MDGAEEELRPTIDPEWLDQQAHREPLVHAYTLWDLRTAPDRIRVVSCVRRGVTVGYLLIWLGRPERPVVHWYGELPDAAALSKALPKPPFVAVVPPAARGLIVPGRGSVPGFSVLLMERDRSALSTAAERSAVRSLTRDDRPALADWVDRHPDSDVQEYRKMDPEAEIAWGSFDGDRIVGVARAAVRLPTVWVLAGVYVDPALRRHGVGQSLVAAAMNAASREGAKLGLFVREDAESARRLYEGLGFRPVGRRLWLEIGRAPTVGSGRTDLPPTPE